MTEWERTQLKIISCKVRMGVINATHSAKAGHPGGSLSAADIFTYAMVINMATVKPLDEELVLKAAGKCRKIITCEEHSIPLPTFLVKILQNYAADPKAYILSGDKVRYLEPRTMQNRFKSYVKESQIEQANFHDSLGDFRKCLERPSYRSCAPCLGFWLPAPDAGAHRAQ